MVNANRILEILKGIADTGRRYADRVAAGGNMAKIIGLYRDDSKGRDDIPIKATRVTVFLTRGPETREVAPPP